MPLGEALRKAGSLFWTTDGENPEEVQTQTVAVEPARVTPQFTTVPVSRPGITLSPEAGPESTFRVAPVAASGEEVEEMKRAQGVFFEELDKALDTEDSPAVNEFMIHFESISTDAPELPIGKRLTMALNATRKSLQAHGQDLPPDQLTKEIGHLIEFLGTETTAFVAGLEEEYKGAVEASNSETVGKRKAIEDLKDRKTELQAQITKIEADIAALDRDVSSQDEHLQGLRLKKDRKAGAFKQAAGQHGQQLEALLQEVRKITQGVK